MTRRMVTGGEAERWLHGCASVGANVVLSGRPSINIDKGDMRIGNECALASRPVVSHFVAGPGATLDIGDGVSIGHGAAIAAYERVRIGAGSLIGPFVIIMDTNFHGSPGNQSVQHDCRPVEIGRHCVIGSRVTITRGVTIGDGAEVLAGSVVSGSIPAGACAAGARVRIIGEAGALTARWDSASARLPLVVAELWQLGAVPELDAPLSSVSAAGRDHSRRLADAIAAEFGADIDETILQPATPLREIATAIERSRDARVARRVQ